jgi:hypothetical protein
MWELLKPRLNSKTIALVNWEKLGSDPLVSQRFSQEGKPFRWDFPELVWGKSRTKIEVVTRSKSQKSHMAHGITKTLPNNVGTPVGPTPINATPINNHIYIMVLNNSLFLMLIVTKV